MSTQLSLIPERIPYIVIMADYDKDNSETERSVRRVQRKLYNGNIPHIDLRIHEFVVVLDQEKSAENPGVHYRRYYSNLLCACRSLTYYAYFGGFIVEVKTGRVISMEQAWEEVRKYPNG